MQLNNLSSSGKKRKTIGRGGSRGGTSGKGHKGQKARSGGMPRIAFEGGQTPLFRRLPKRGFNNFEFRKVYELVNLQQLNDAFNDGEEVTKLALHEKGLVKFKKAQSTLIKVLGNGSLDKKLIVHADAFSKTAEKAIQERGGEARLTKEN
ncbi:MAG: 50S ribosomal protein L15 [Candidatus Dependentiae bacterium]|nr:50S ribosomal protein L15 [Candidatus Dependentiae bacterium]